MILRQTLDKPVHGYWDGGAEQVFDWETNGVVHSDSKGEFTKVGSFEANHWFCVALGRTEKLTLSYARVHLQSSTRYPSTFEYIG